MSRDCPSSPIRASTPSSGSENRFAASARFPPRAAVVGLVSLLGACSTGELSESWLLDRLRVLGVQPQPAEAAPGDTLTFDSLVISPDLELEAVVWFACLPESADEYGCEIDEDLLDVFEDLDPAELDPEDLAEAYEDLQEAGLIGIEPWLSPSYEVSEDILDDLDEDERYEGLDLFVQITAIPVGAETDSDLELAYKRVPISEARTPNHNPEIETLAIDGVELEEDTLAELDASRTYTLEPILSDDSVEDYLYLDSSGTWDKRTEEPYYTLYVTGGEPDQAYAVHPYADMEWTTPDGDTTTEHTLWVLVQDRRGGMDWWTQEVRIRDEAR